MQVSKSLFSSLSSKNKLEFFEELAFLLDANFNLTEALRSLENNKNYMMRKLIKIFIKDIEAGSSFSDCFKNRAKHFFPVTISHLIASAEETGELALICKKIAENLRYSEDMKKKIVSAVTYPLIVFIITFIVGALLTIVLIPKLADKLQSKGVALPPLTQFLINLSDYIRNNGLKIIIALICITLFLVLSFKFIKTIRIAMEWFFLKIPFIGQIVANAITSQICFNMSLLLSSGVNIINSLKILKNIIKMEIFKQKFEEGQNHILLGKKLHESLKTDLLPDSLFDLIKIGEQSGNLNLILEKTGTHYEIKTEQKISIMIKIINPVTLLIVALIVGIVYISFFQAIMRLSSS